LGAFVEEQAQVSRTIVNKAAVEVLGDSRAGTTATWQRKRLVGGVTLLVLASTILFGIVQYQHETLVATPATQFSAPPTPLLGRMNALIGYSTPEPALGEVLSAWGHSDPPTTTQNACELVEQFGLACFSGTGNLQDLIRIDRPVAINIGTNDRANWITLVALSDNLSNSLNNSLNNSPEDSLANALDNAVDENMARILVTSRQQWIDQAALIATGEHAFTLMWLMPTDYQKPLTLGDSGASVDWLVNRLTQVESNRAILEAGYIFDLNLEQRVKVFQLAAGITANGIVGPRTWIALNNSNANIPRLRKGGQP